MAFDYEYQDEESWARAGRRKRVGMIAFVAVAVLTLVVGIGAVLWAFTGSDGSNRTPVAAAAPSEPGASPVDEGTFGPTDPPSVVPSPTASPTPSPTKKTKTKVKTQPPPKNEPVAPPPPKRSPGCTPKHFGTDAPKAEVRKALDATAHRVTTRASRSWSSRPSCSTRRPGRRAAGSRRSKRVTAGSARCR